MTRFLLPVLLLAVFSGPALACGDGAEGSCCGGKKSAVQDASAADSELARQAAATMLETSEAPTGELTEAQRESLTRDSANVRTTLQTAHKGACCDHGDGEQCGESCCDHDAGDRCPAKTSNATSTSMPKARESVSPALEVVSNRNGGGDKCKRHKA